MIEPTPDELNIYDDISALAEVLWELSTVIYGLNNDPKMFSIMLYKRLRSNQMGYTALWKLNLDLEASIILRSAVEAAICIAANSKLMDRFVLLMRQDAAFTVQGQIKMHRENGAQQTVREGEAGLRLLLASLPPGVKAAKLDWGRLALEGGVPQLYGFHRMLSGVSSHVTGLSLLRGVTNDRMETGQAELRGLERKMHLMMMAGAMLQGTRLHAGMIGAHRELERAIALTERLEAISMSWPGAGDEGD